MPTALANRFIHLDFEVSIEDWRIWAISNKIDPLITGFLRLRPELLFNMDNTDRGFPTPRSWHMLSDALLNFDDKKEALDIIIGIVGEAAAMEFHGYITNSISEEYLESIIADPNKCKLPKEIGDQYAIISYLTYHAKKEKIRQVSGILLNRIEPELAVLLAKDLVRSSAKFALNQDYLKFAAKTQRISELKNLTPRLQRARIQLMLKHPYLSSATARLNFIIIDKACAKRWQQMDLIFLLMRIFQKHLMKMKSLQYSLTKLCIAFLGTLIEEVIEINYFGI